MMKGFGYTLEVMIAISIVLIFTVFIFGSAIAPATSSTASIRKQGFEALEYLDRADELRPLVAAGNDVQLRKRLNDILPPGIALDLDICTSSCLGHAPNKKTAISIDYYVSGNQQKYVGKKLKLWLWGNF